MTMWRVPIFTWAILVTSILVLIAFPVLTAALLGLASDRHFGSHVFDPANGGAILYQHLFWFFGHPEVYIVALPFFGIISEVIPVFSRKPVFGYRGMVFAMLGIAALSSAVWAHHMFATGAVLLPFFSFMTFLIAIPTGLKFFNWIGTMWKGQVSFETPMLFACGFLVTFLFGGLTGVILAAPALDFHVSDTYFVVAHFHYVLFGTIVFATYSGIYFWFPKMTGRFLDERLGRLHFWTTFIGFHLTFLIQHWLGNIGMPRRYPDYLPTDGFTTLNTISTIGAFVLGASMLPFVWNVIRSWRYGEITTADDPWGYGNSLEWATSSPPPRHNFTSLPRIRSERPAFELHHPHMVDRLRTEAHPHRGWQPLQAAESSPHLAIGTTSNHAGRDDPHKPRCRPSGRFSRRSGASPPPAPGRTRSGGPQRTKAELDRPGRRNTGKRFERHEHGVGIIGISYPAGGVGGRDGPVLVQHPAVAVPALPGPDRGPRRPGPPADRPRPRRPGTADRLRRGAVQPPVGPARPRRHPGGDHRTRRPAGRTGRHPPRPGDRAVPRRRRPA